MDQHDRLTGAVVFIVQLDVGGVFFPDCHVWHKASPFIQPVLTDKTLDSGVDCRRLDRCISHRSSVSTRGAVGTSEALTTLVIRSFRSISMVT